MLVPNTYDTVLAKNFDHRAQREASSRPGAEKKGNGEKKGRKGRENERRAYLVSSLQYSLPPLDESPTRLVNF